MAGLRPSNVGRHTAVTLSYINARAWQSAMSPRTLVGVAALLGLVLLASSASILDELPDVGDEEEEDAKEREDAGGDDKEDKGQSEIRAEVEKRLKRLGKSSDNSEEDKN